MKTRPPATTGELLPSPAGFRHSTLSWPFHGVTFSVEELSRRGPSHCGQSSASAGAVALTQTSAVNNIERSQCMTGLLRVWRPRDGGGNGAAAHSATAPHEQGPTLSGDASTSR